MFWMRTPKSPKAVTKAGMVAMTVGVAAQLMPGGHAGFYGLEHAIPETDSGADGVASGCSCFRLPRRIAATKLVQQQPGERTVGFFIH